jgi:hypothetical protein
MEASIWTERMVSALRNGVKGGCWFSLIDKVYAPKAHLPMPKPSTAKSTWRWKP